MNYYQIYNFIGKMNFFYKNKNLLRNKILIIIMCKLNMMDI